MNDQLILRSHESAGCLSLSTPEIAVPKKGLRGNYRGLTAIFHKKDESISELFSRLLREKQTGEIAFRELQKKLNNHLGSDNQDRRGRR